MRRFARASLLAMFTICAFGFLSCSEDDDPSSPGGGSSNPDDIRANLVVNDVVLPLMRHVFIGEYMGVAGNNASDGARACEPANICSSGSSEVCIDPGSFQLTFTSCQIGATVFNGTVSLTTEVNSGSGTIDITVVDESVGSISISGDMSYTSDENCFGQFITNAVVTTPNIEINMAGSSFWCDPYATVGEEIIPSSANFEFIFPSLDRLVDVALFSDPVGDMEVVVLNQNRTKVLRICHGTFTQGNLSCSAGPDAAPY